MNKNFLVCLVILLNFATCLGKLHAQSYKKLLLGSFPSKSGEPSSSSLSGLDKYMGLSQRELGLYSEENSIPDEPDSDIIKEWKVLLDEQRQYQNQMIDELLKKNKKDGMANYNIIDYDRDSFDAPFFNF